LRTPAEFKSFANEVRLAIQSIKDAGEAHSREVNATELESAHLIGPEHLDPTFEQQLDFSSRGASLTVAIPAAQLSKFIEQLTLGEGQATTLRMLPAREIDAVKTAESLTNSQPISLWISEGAQARQAIAQLEQRGNEAVVLVPVIVQTNGDTRSNRSR
jgi:hypothetical protein